MCYQGLESGHQIQTRYLKNYNKQPVSDKTKSKKDTKYRICFFGTYEKNYSRNLVLIEGLKALGVDVYESHNSIFTPAKNRSDFDYSISSLVLKAFKLLFIYPILITRALRMDFDLLLVGYMGHLDIFAAKLVSKIKNVPIIFNPLISLHDTLVNDRKKFSPYSVTSQVIRHLDSLSCELSDAVILDTNNNIEFFKREFNLHHKMFYTVPVGAQSIFFPKASDTGKISLQTKTKVLFVGSFVPLQGVEYVCEAINMLKGETGLEFSIIGSGQNSEEIICAYKLRENKQVTLIDWVDYQQLPSCYQKSDICLGVFGDNPKTQRVIPNKVFFGIACQKAVITGDVPALNGIMENGKHAVLCPLGNAASIAEAILKLHRNPELRAKIATEGYTLFKERFTAEVIASELLSKIYSLFAVT